MNRYAYDFDKTIYDGDSTIDFFFFVMKENPILLRFIPKISYGFIKYYLRCCSKTELKSYFFSFLSGINNIDILINEFWILNKKKIKNFYLEKSHEKDIIISASPEFLLKPVCEELQIDILIASNVDKKTGKFLSSNCYGKEKLKRLRKDYPQITLLEFYSDSKSDLPLAQVSEKAFLVNGNQIDEWIISNK